MLKSKSMKKLNMLCDVLLFVFVFVCVPVCVCMSVSGVCG